MIACDTSALSQFLRRSPDTQNDIAHNIERLIEANELALFGIVRQELLSGLKLPAHFERIDLTTQALPLFFADTKTIQQPQNFLTRVDRKEFKVPRSIF